MMETSTDASRTSSRHDYVALISNFAALSSVGLAIGAASVVSPSLMAIAALGAAVAAGTKLYDSRRSSK
jgi:hypothetical protein